MKGNHKNYGKSADCKKVTLRLYGELRQRVEILAGNSGVSAADVVVRLLETFFLDEVGHEDE
jgi:predicted DNA-binding protein